MSGCCCLNDKEIRSYSESTSHGHLQGSLDWTGRANVLASQVTGPHTNGLLLIGRIKPRFTRRQLSEVDLIARIVEAAATIRQQPDIFESTHQTLLHRFRLCIEVGGHMFEHLL